jgi:hypothetical protein
MKCLIGLPLLNTQWVFESEVLKIEKSESEVLKIEESESEVLKIEESESEVLCTDCTALLRR